MGQHCSGPNAEDLLDTVNQVSTYFVMVMVVLTIIIVVAFTIYIFCFRTSEQRPLFVTWQTILLNLFWIFISTYYIDIIVKLKTDPDYTIDVQTKMQNFYSSTADFFFVIHDWLFILEYLQASLILPVAITYFGQEDRAEEALIQK